MILFGENIVVHVLTEIAIFWARILDLYYQCSVGFFFILGFLRLKLSPYTESSPAYQQV